MTDLCVREWSEIHKGGKNNCKDIDKIILNSDTWDYLAKYADSADKNHRFLRFKNSNTLKVQNFVGVITAPDGTQIEIFPKISEDKNCADDSRTILMKMLKVVNDLPFIQTTNADLQLTNQLLEIVINHFLSELDKIIKCGIRFDYCRVEAHEKFLKGQLQLNQQLNEPPHKQHLFHIEYDIFSPNRVENRLIHSALVQILKYSKGNQNKKSAKHFLMFFDEVPLSKNYKNDFEKWSKSRDMNYYQPIFPWLKLILNQQSPFTLKDKNAGISFLIPMERLFEKYVAKILAKQLPQGYKLTEQHPQKYLVEKPNAFMMKPDMVISNDKKPVYVLDTKWKLIDENQQYKNGNTDDKKGISQADIYQLFAYGKKYKVKKVMLIYPKWQKFTTKFNFTLDDDLQLDVVAFSLNDNKEFSHDLCGSIIELEQCKNLKSVVGA